MRLFRLSILSISLIALLAYCESPTPDNSNEMKVVDSLDTQRDPANTTSDQHYTDTLSQNAAGSDSPSADGVDRTKMYRDLGMTDDEIKRFEDDFNRKVKSIMTHGRGDYTRQDIENQEGQSMNAVLSHERYKKYLEWKEIHPEYEETNK